MISIIIIIIIIMIIIIIINDMIIIIIIVKAYRPVPPMPGAEARAQSRDREKDKKYEEERVEQVDGQEEEQQWPGKKALPQQKLQQATELQEVQKVKVVLKHWSPSSFCQNDSK